MSLPTSGAWVNVTHNLAGHACACGTVNCMDAVPNQNKVIVGVAGGQGLFATTDNGASWQPMGVSTDWVDELYFVFDKDNPDIFWETGIHGGKIHKTTDGGKTFSIIGFQGGDGMAVDMTDPQRKTIVSGGHEGANLNVSTDGGVTWTNITAGTSGWTNFPVVINAQTFIEGGSNGGGIYRTTNGGTNWTKVSSMSPGWNFIVAPDGSVYCAASGNQSILKSTDQGATWTSISKPGSGAPCGPIAMPDGSIVALGQNALVQCSDGKTWKQIGSTLPSTGLTMQRIAYNSVARSFYMSFSDCNSTVPAGAVWKEDVVSSSIIGESKKADHLHPVSNGSAVIVAAGHRVSVSTAGYAGLYDLFGRRIQSARWTGNGIAVVRLAKR
jgi:photosystem II stability/assembly factor-like uncharacterized protein